MELDILLLLSFFFKIATSNFKLRIGYWRIFLSTTTRTHARTKHTHTSLKLTDIDPTSSVQNCLEKGAGLSFAEPFLYCVQPRVYHSDLWSDNLFTEICIPSHHSRSWYCLTASQLGHCSLQVTGNIAKDKIQKLYHMFLRETRY